MSHQRLRIRYRKVDRVRFVSARDLTAVWERALRRVDLPIAYSEGFHPHAKVSFPDALPVGYSSTGEYAEMTFAAPIDPGPDLARLSATLPAGMDVTTYQEVPDGAPKLARSLEATIWELAYPPLPRGEAADAVALLQELVAAAMSADDLLAIRQRPEGDRTVQVRPAVIALAASSQPRDPKASDPEDEVTYSPMLRAVLRNDGPTVRPTDLHQALCRLASPEASDPEAADTSPPVPRMYSRVVQGTVTEGGLHEALTQDYVALAPDRLVGAA